jgi:Mg-chelatase subunit ChlD
VASDLLAIVPFSWEAKVAAPLSPVESPGLIRALEGLKPVGNTNTPAALRVALGMLSALPPRIVRRITLISDGEVNLNKESLPSITSDCRSAFIAIDAVAVGAKDGLETLRAVVDGTVGGRYRDAHDAVAIARAVCQGPATGPHRRQGAHVLLLDCSTSMEERLRDGVRRIDAARAAALALIELQRKRFSAVSPY